MFYVKQKINVLTFINKNNLHKQNNYYNFVASNKEKSLIKS